MRLDLIKLCIIDEVDMMLDYGFMGDIDWIVSHLQDHTSFLHSVQQFLRDCKILCKIFEVCWPCSS